MVFESTARACLNSSYYKKYSVSRLEKFRQVSTRMTPSECSILTDKLPIVNECKIYLEESTFKKCERHRPLP